MGTLPDNLTRYFTVEQRVSLLHIKTTFRGPKQAGPILFHAMEEEGTDSSAPAIRMTPCPACYIAADGGSKHSLFDHCHAMIRGTWLIILQAACGAFAQQTSWVIDLRDQVVGALYTSQNGDNTSRLVYGHAVDPFDQEEGIVPAAVLVAQGTSIFAPDYVA